MIRAWAWDDNVEFWRWKHLFSSYNYICSTKVKSLANEQIITASERRWLEESRMKIISLSNLLGKSWTWGGVSWRQKYERIYWNTPMFVSLLVHSMCSWTKKVLFTRNIPLYGHNWINFSWFGVSLHVFTNQCVFWLYIQEGELWIVEMIKIRTGFCI